MSRGKNATQQQIYEIYRQLDNAFLPALKHLSETGTALHKSLVGHKKAFAEHLQSLSEIAVSGKGTPPETEKTANELQELVQLIKKIDSNHNKLVHTFGDLLKRIQENASTEKEDHRKKLNEFIKEEKVLLKEVSKKRKTKKDLSTFYTKEEQSAIKLQRSRYAFFLNKHKQLLMLYAEYVVKTTTELENFLNNKPLEVKSPMSVPESLQPVVGDVVYNSHTKSTTASEKNSVTPSNNDGIISKYLNELKRIDNLDSPQSKGPLGSPLSQRTIVIDENGTVNSTRSILKKPTSERISLEKVYLPPQEEEKPKVKPRTKNGSFPEETAVASNKTYDLIHKSFTPKMIDQNAEQLSNNRSVTPVQLYANSQQPENRPQPLLTTDQDKELKLQHEQLRQQQKQLQDIQQQLQKQQLEQQQQKQLQQPQFVPVGYQPSTYNPQFQQPIVYSLPPQIMQVNPNTGWQIPTNQIPSMASTRQSPATYIPVNATLLQGATPVPAHTLQSPPEQVNNVLQPPQLHANYTDKQQNILPSSVPLPRPGSVIRNNLLNTKPVDKPTMVTANQGGLSHVKPSNSPPQKYSAQTKQTVLSKEKPLYTASDYGAMMVVIVSYQASAERRITLEEGDRVELLKSGERGWVLLKTYGPHQRIGWYPSKFVRRATAMEAHQYVNTH